MDTKTQGAANAASPAIDSLQLIARDAATFAEGAGEPEFSQFLNIEARILRMVRVKASLEPFTNALADALEAAVNAHGCGPGCGKCDAPWCVQARAALHLAGRLP